MFKISQSITLDMADIDIQFIRSQGPGGQHVNKTSTAVHLFLDIHSSKSLPCHLKEKLLALSDHRISKSGKIIIKSQASRSQELNREQALEQLVTLLKKANHTDKKRIATKPTFGGKMRRLDKKNQRGQQKKMRKRISY